LRKGKLEGVRGFGTGIQESLRHVLSEDAGQPQRTKLLVAEQTVVPLLAALRQVPGVRQAEVTGSYRRRRETVGDVDVVVAAEPPEPSELLHPV
jgi:DNA polymerase (family X)